MGQPERIAIVGAGHAGSAAAIALREAGFDGSIVLVGDESAVPYERPALSKGLIDGSQAASDIVSRPASEYAENDITLRLGVSATAIDPHGQQLALSTGESLGYDRLLLATGSRNRILPIPGIDLPGVHNLRTLADAERLRADLVPGARAVILGMGFIGSEVAASLRALDIEVTVVEALAGPVVNALGVELSSVLRDTHAAHGVTMFFDDTVVALEGSDRIERVRTSAGRTLECDLVVFGFGTLPNVELAASAGCAVDGGILVDEYGQTSVPGIFAAGDAARFAHPTAARPLRVEHWQHALLHAKAVANNMVAEPIAYDAVPWFWSNQYEARLHYAGFHGSWDRSVVIGSIPDRSFHVLYFANDTLVGVAALNRPREVRQMMGLIAERATLEHPALAEAIRQRDLAEVRTR